MVSGTVCSPKDVKNRRSSAVTVPAISPASAIIDQKLWQKPVATVSAFLTVGSWAACMHHALRRPEGWGWAGEKPTVRKALTVATNSEAVESANGGERGYTLDEKSDGLQKGNRYGGKRCQVPFLLTRFPRV